MNTTRKRNKNKGGNNTMIQYAMQIKNKKPINLDIFQKYLNSISNPLFQLYDFDNNGVLYTINEYALIHDADVTVQAVFNNFSVNLEHLVQYNSLRKDPLTILEAYILQSKFVLNIQYILENIDPNALFRYFDSRVKIPTVLMCAIESCNYKNSIFSHSIYQTVIELYSQPELYNRLSNHNSPEIVTILFQFATMFNKPDFMIKIYLYLTQTPNNIHDGLNLLFNADIITNILLHDDPILYKTAVELINFSDENFVKEILIDYANQNFNNQEKDESSNAIIQYLKLKPTQNAKTLFEKLGKHTIQNIILPYSDNDIRLIVICHGTTVNNTTIQIDFPFKKLCFFVEKGEKLQNYSIISRSIEELICAGNYDKNLKCVESTNNIINIDNMVFKFENKTLLDKNNETAGFYVCENRKVSKLHILGVDDSLHYTFNEIVKICNQICKQSKIPTDKVNLMFFSCRGSESVKEIVPEPIVRKES